MSASAVAGGSMTPATQASGGPAPPGAAPGAVLGASVTGQAVATAATTRRSARPIALAPPSARVLAPVRPAVPAVGVRWRVELPPEVTSRRGALELPAAAPGYGAAASRSQVAELAGRLRATAALRRSKLLEGTLALKATLAAEGEAKKGTVRSAVNEALRSIRAETASARAAIASQTKRCKAETTAMVPIKLGELQVATATRLSETEASAARWQENAAKQVTTRQEAAREFGVAEGRRGKQAVDAQAEKARTAARTKAGGYPKDERGGVQAEAVLITGEKIAKKLAEPGPDIQSKAEEAGRKLADGFDGAEAKVVDHIGEQARKLGAEVRGHTLDLEPQFDSIRTEALGELDDVASAINTQLDGVEEASRTELTAVLAEVAGRIDESVTSINEILDRESAAAAGALVAVAERTVAAVLSAKRPNVAVVRRVVADAEGSIVATAEQYESGLADIERVTLRSFALGDTAVTRGTARIAYGVSKGLTKATGAGRRALAGVVGTARKSADAVIEHWVGVIDEAAKGLDARFGEAVAGLGRELQKGLDKGKAAITTQVDKAIAKNAEPLAQLDTKLEEAAAEAREKYDAPWYKKLGRWLLSALKSFFIALAKFLGLVALLVLGIVLIVAGLIYGITALIVIGVIFVVGVLAYTVYGIIAGIVARVRSANTWWQGIWGFAVGILDITGLPGVIEGLISHDIVNGRKLTVEEAGSRFGAGLFGVLTFIIPLKLRGKVARATGGRPPIPPGEKPPLQLPAGEPTVIGPERQLPAGEPTVIGPERQLPAGEPTVIGPERQLPAGEPTVIGPERQLPAGEPTVIGPERQLPAGEPARIGPERQLPAGEPARIGPERQLPAGEPARIPPERPARIPPERPARIPPERPARIPPERAARLDELARDYLDHGGQETPGTRAEAEAALGVEETQGLGPFRRPRRGEGHAGDFVDETTGIDWDVKRPRSREALHTEIRERAREQGRPEPRLDPNRPMRGEFDLAEQVADIRNELATGENVIIDTRSLNPDQIAALRAAIADPANHIPAGSVVLWP
jgi:hypothetical protein